MCFGSPFPRPPRAFPTRCARGFLACLAFPACCNFPLLVHAPIPRLGSDWCGYGATTRGAIEAMASRPRLGIAVWGLPCIKSSNQTQRPSCTTLEVFSSATSLQTPQNSRKQSSLALLIGLGLRPLTFTCSGFLISHLLLIHTYNPNVEGQRSQPLRAQTLPHVTFT